MSPQGRGWGALGGAVAALVTGTGIAVARGRQRISHERQLATELAEHVDPGTYPRGEISSLVADDGVRLVCEEITPSNGRRAALTVILVHGFALDRRTWHFQRRSLSQLEDLRVRVVMYDQRSHGESERAPRETCTIDQLGRDLDAVIRGLAPRGPIVLVGHSMGGMAVMALAEQRPDLFAERVAGVGLISTSAGEVASAGLPGTLLSRHNVLTRAVGALARWHPGFVESVRRAASDLIWALTRRYAYGDRRIHPAMVDLVDSMISANAVDALTDFVDTLNSHDRLAALPALTRCEVLVAAGDADRVLPFRHSEVIAAELPQATLLRLPGAGHMPMLEQPEALDAALVELVRRAARRAGSGALRRMRLRRRM